MIHLEMVPTASLLITVLVGLGRCPMPQDPLDPLVLGPGLMGGSRLQHGDNLFPSDWKVDGKLREISSVNLDIKGFQMVTLDKASATPKKSNQDSFQEIPCEFMGTTPLVTVFAQNGTKAKFAVDSGALKSYIQPALAQAWNRGNEAPFPMVLMLSPGSWVHFKTEVDRNVRVLAIPGPDFRAEGILGMNALSGLQLKVDYRHRKLWARLSPRPFEGSDAATELTPGKLGTLKTVGLHHDISGRFALDATIGKEIVPLEVDTGANVLGLTSEVVKLLKLEKSGEGAVLVERGTRALDTYLAPPTVIGDIPLLWPVTHRADSDETKLGGFGPALFPHPVVIIDYPGLCLYTVSPTADETIAQALGQLISGVVRIEGTEVVLDLPDIVGKSRAVLVKVQDRPISTVLIDLRGVLSGKEQSRKSLENLFRQLTVGGHITIRQDQILKLIEISPAG